MEFLDISGVDKAQGIFHVEDKLEVNVLLRSHHHIGGRRVLTVLVDTRGMLPAWVVKERCFQGNGIVGILHRI